MLRNTRNISCLYPHDKVSIWNFFIENSMSLSIVVHTPKQIIQGKHLIQTVGSSDVQIRVIFSGSSPRHFITPSGWPHDAIFSSTALGLSCGITHFAWWLILQEVIILQHKSMANLCMINLYMIKILLGENWATWSLFHTFENTTMQKKEMNTYRSSAIILDRLPISWFYIPHLD